MNENLAENNDVIDTVLAEFGFDREQIQIVAFGSGLVNSTWKITDKNSIYIFQRINKSVFKKPQDIAENIEKLKIYLQKVAPDYLFVAAIPAKNGRFLVEYQHEFYRLMPFVKNSHTINAAERPQQAFEAALQFGRFTRLLNDFDLAELKHTLPDFHNLTLRFNQFEKAYQNAEPNQIEQAKEVIAAVFANQNIAEKYSDLVENGEIPMRVIHHDTKINNVLFLDEQERGLCVIDLDTVMPGFYLSDVGDMLRTLLSPASEEEQDLAKISIREDFFAAIYQGYMQEMNGILTSAEKKLFIFSGSMMMYMQGLRFLADFLNGDIYYHTVFTGQNLARAKNQFELLRQYQQKEDKLTELMLLLAPENH